MPVCWICHEEEMVLPFCCKCTGELGFAHSLCLAEWAKRQSICNMCQAPYSVPGPSLSQCVYGFALWLTTTACLLVVDRHRGDALVVFVLALVTTVYLLGMIRIGVDYFGYDVLDVAVPVAFFILGANLALARRFPFASFGSMLIQNRTHKRAFLLGVGTISAYDLVPPLS